MSMSAIDYNGTFFRAYYLSVITRTRYSFVHVYKSAH